MSETVSLKEVAWEQARETLLAIRFAVFVDEQGVPPELEVDEQDATARHLLVSDPQGHPLATARLLPNGHIGRMAVVAEQRGKRIGMRMLQALLHMAGEAGLSRVYLNAQCSAEGFYRRAGFVAEGEVFDDAGIPHRRMSRPLREQS